MADSDAELENVLHEAQQEGFLGKGDVADYIAHARAHAELALGNPANTVFEPDADPLQCLDLGSGGGVPGLVVALDYPDIAMTLLERSDRRCEFLATVIVQLNLTDSTIVECADAADAAHMPTHRQNYDYVFSRSFGKPALVAECAAGLLIPGGELIASEPPVSDPARWPANPLAKLGIELIEITDTTPHFAVLRKVDLCSDEHPRPWAKMLKQPLY